MNLVEYIKKLFFKKHTTEDKRHPSLIAREVFCSIGEHDYNQQMTWLSIPKKDNNKKSKNHESDDIEEEPHLMVGGHCKHCGVWKVARSSC